MNSQHARSPTIKIVAGENEIFGEEDLDLPLNVFYVNKTLLLENSTYFTIILDSAPERAVVFLPEHNYEVVADWLDLLYQGALDRSTKRALDPEYVHRYFKFADLVGSEQLKNEVMNSMQMSSAGGTKWNLGWVRALERLDLASSAPMEFIFECLAFRIVIGGWTRFIEDREKLLGCSWDEFISDKGARHHFTRLLAKVDELNTLKDHKKLIRPPGGTSCKYHEHWTKESKANCPGSTDLDMYKESDLALWPCDSSSSDNDDDTPTTDGEILPANSMTRFHPQGTFN